MKELSLNILDITENSTKAGAKNVSILIDERTNILTLVITDDGCGMTNEVLQSVTNPFYTTRTTRKVGLGLPLLKLACEQTGGELKVESKHESQFSDHGTVVKATFDKNHIDFTPMGDIVATITTLIHGHEQIDFVFNHLMIDKEVKLDTKELRTVLGEIPLNSFEVINWIGEYLKEQYEQ